MEKIQEKLQILASAAKYDVSCSSSGSKRKNIDKGLGDASFRIGHLYRWYIWDFSETVKYYREAISWYQKIANEVKQVFNFFEDNSRKFQYKHLLVSPTTSRTGFVRLIDNEIKNAKKD